MNNFVILVVFLVFYTYNDVGGKRNFVPFDNGRAEKLYGKEKVCVILIGNTNLFELGQ